MEFVILNKSKQSLRSPRPLKSSNNNEACVKGCVCNRKRDWIICTNCEKKFEGRISQKCPVHPKTAFLMDSRSCGFCGADKEWLTTNDPEQSKDVDDIMNRKEN